MCNVNMLKCALNFSPTYDVTYRKTFVCFCRRTFRFIHTTFITVYTISNMNRIYKFQGIWRFFTRVKACTDKHAYRIHKYFLTLLENIKNFLLTKHIFQHIYRQFLLVVISTLVGITYWSLLLCLKVLCYVYFVCKIYPNYLVHI